MAKQKRKETVPQIINRCFNMAWKEFGEDKSTEFIAQITAERLGVTVEEVFDALIDE